MGIFLPCCARDASNCSETSCLAYPVSQREFIALVGGAIAWPVPVGNSRSDILVMQSAQNWHGQRLTDCLDGTGDRRVLLQ